MDIRSYGYAGGTTSSGTVVSAGGFDTILTLFTASGAFIDDNDTGTGVLADPATGFAGDARLIENLAAGNYIVALTEYDNFSIGNLSDGFAETGNPNFTASPTFTSGAPCPGNLFRDISGTPAGCRSSNWAIDFQNVTGASAVPEPSALLLAGFGLVLVGLRHRWNRAIKAILLATVLAGLGAPVRAQSTSGPDYSGVTDFLNGTRNLLEKQDLQVFRLSSYRFAPDEYYFRIAQVTTSNSNQTNSNNIPSYYNQASPYDPLFSFSAHMFNQPAAITLTNLNNFKQTGTLQLWLQNVDSLAPGKDGTWQPSGNGDNPALQGGAVADFNGDGFDDLALSLNTGQGSSVIWVITPNDVNDATKGFRKGVTSTASLTTLTAGDFNGDGKPEIAGLSITPGGGLKLIIYTVDPVALTLTEATSLVLTTPAGTPVNRASIARGRFNVTSYDQLVIAFSTPPNGAQMEIIDFDANSLTAHERLPQTGTTLPGVTNAGGFIEVKTGKFGLPNNPYDQVVYHNSSPTTASGSRFIQVYKADPTTLSLTGTGPILYDQFPCAQGIQVGNFDHQQAGGGHNPNEQVAFLYCGGQEPDDEQREYLVLNIYSVDPDSLGLINPPDSGLGLDSAGIWIDVTGATTQSVALVATDLQGRSLVLSAPSELTITSGVQPDVVVGLPPMHMDFIPSDPSAVGPSVLFNTSAAPDGFNATYQQDQSAGNGNSSTNGTSWSFGAKEKVSGGFTLGDPDVTGLSVNDTFTAAQNLKGLAEHTHGTYTAQDISLNLGSGTDDTVNYTDNTTHIWAYQVIGQKVCPLPNLPPPCLDIQKVPLTIQFSAVDGDAAVANKQGYALPWYQPVWEPFNIFSYPANLAQLQAAYPNLAVLSNPQTFATDATSVVEQVKWDVKDKEAATASLKQNYSFENDFSASLKVGVPAVESDSASFDIDLSGSVGFSSLNKSSTDLAISTGITITKKASFPQPQTYAYSVTPYVLGSRQPGGFVDNVPLPADVSTFTQLQVAYAASIDTDQQAWWNHAYGAHPDVALNHPSRWQVSNPPQSNNMPSNCLVTGATPPVDCLSLSSRSANDAWSSVYHQMRGFFISKANLPGQGPQLQESKVTDVLQLQARVYNYSFASMAGDTVHAQFFFAPYDTDSSAIDDTKDQLINEVVINDGIPPYSPTGGTPNWLLATTKFDPSQFSYTKGGGVTIAFWVLVWIEDANHNLVQEINGHGLTSKPPPAPNQVPSFQAAAALEECQADGCYSNNLGIYHLPYYIDAAGLGQPGPPRPPGAYSLGKINLSTTRPVIGQDVNVSVSFSPGGLQGALFSFYDGDPNRNGRAFATESLPNITKGSQPLIRTTYRANQCGVHQLFAVLNQGKPTEIVRRAEPIRVSCGTN